MRRLLVSGLVACAPFLASPAVAQAPPSPSPPATAPAQAEPATEETTRSLFERTWRQFTLGGRLSSVEGDPARFQRYEDLSRRAAVHRSALRARSGRRRLVVPCRCRQRRLARPALLRRLRPAGPVHDLGLWDRSRSLQRRHATPYQVASDGALVLNDAVQRAIETGRARSTRGCRLRRRSSWTSDATSAR